MASARVSPPVSVAIDRLDLEVRQGEFLSLLGPSGCGKSTALRLIAGLGEPSSGAIRWANGPTAGKSDIGFVFQEPTLMPWQTVYGNVALPLQLHGAPRDDVEVRRDPLAGTGRAGRFRQRLPARALGRHEDARVDRTCARHRTKTSADGRAVRGARRDHAFQAQQRPDAGRGCDWHHGRVRHPFGVRVGVPVEADRGDDAASRPRLRRTRTRCALSAQRGIPNLDRICGLLPARLRSLAQAMETSA